MARTVSPILFNRVDVLSSPLAASLDISNSDIIHVRRERLTSLEELEQSIPSIIEKAINDYKREKLKKLHENDKKNPAGVNARVKRYNAKNKEKINAKRLLKQSSLHTTSTVVHTEQTTVSENKAEFVIAFK